MSESSYLLGIKEVDRQHKELIERAQRLSEMIATGADSRSIGELFKFLEDYAIEHFGSEERVMFFSRYPEYLTHRNLHSEFVIRLAEISSEYKTNGASPGVILSLEEWLKEWVEKHIDVDDRHFCDYVRAQQSAIPASRSGESPRVSGRRKKADAGRSTESPAVHSGERSAVKSGESPAVRSGERAAVTPAGRSQQAQGVDASRAVKKTGRGQPPLIEPRARAFNKDLTFQAAPAQAVDQDHKPGREAALKFVAAKSTATGQAVSLDTGSAQTQRPSNQQSARASDTALITAVPKDPSHSLLERPSKAQPVGTVQSGSADDLTTADIVDPAAMFGRPLLEVLLALELLNIDQATQVQLVTDGVPEEVSKHLLHHSLVSSDALCHAWSLQSGFPRVDSNILKAPVDGRFGVPAVSMLNYQCLPFDQVGSELRVAVCSPLSAEAISVLEQQAQANIRQFLASDQILAVLLDGLRPRMTRKERQYARYELSVPIRYAFTDERGVMLTPSDYTGTTVDIGEMGLRLQGPMPVNWKPEQCMNEGTCIHVAFSLAPHDIRAEGVVRYSRSIHLKSGRGRGLDCGIQIVNIDENAQRQLTQACVRAALWTGLRDPDEFRAYRPGQRRT